MNAAEVLERLERARGSFDWLQCQRFAYPDDERERVELLCAWHHFAALPVEDASAPELLELNQIGAQLGRRLEDLAAAPLEELDDQAERVTTGSKWLRFVTPGDANDKKDQLNAIVEALDADVKRATDLDPAIVSAWHLFRESWNKFYQDKAGWLNAAAQMDHAEDLQDQIHGWEERLKDKKIALSAPDVALADRPSMGELGSAVGNLAKPLLIGGAVVLGVILVMKFGGR